jgi:hypothetical protein
MRAYLRHKGRSFTHTGVFSFSRFFQTVPFQGKVFSLRKEVMPGKAY